MSLICHQSARGTARDFGPHEKITLRLTTTGHANKCNHTCRTTQTIAIALNNYTIAGLELSYSSIFIIRNVLRGIFYSKKIILMVKFLYEKFL